MNLSFDEQGTAVSSGTRRAPRSGAARLSAEDIVRKHEVDAFVIINSYNHNNVWFAARFHSRRHPLLHLSGSEESGLRT